MGMVSACANPIIYVFFNEKFHREFSILYNEAKKGLCCLCTKISSNTLVVSPGANGQDPLGNGRNGKNCSCDFRFKADIEIIEYHIVECYCNIVQILSYFFILQSLTTSKMRKFQNLKLSQFQKGKTCLTEKWDYEQILRGVFFLCFGRQKKI